MLTRWKPLVVVWCVLATAAADTPPGLVAKDSEQDLVAEASHSAPQQAQKREAALSNSYGEPLPADAYGPPSNIPVVSDLQQSYGVPRQQSNIFQTPPGAYGPPAPVVFSNQGYEGPPPPVFRPKPHYGPPKLYGPPKPIFGPPKPMYGPPKKNYGIPKQSLPKPVYGPPFKPQKISFPKPVYGVPKHNYGPPKPVYGPPKVTYGAPLNIPTIPLDFGSVSVSQNLGFGHGGIDNNIDVGHNLPAPIYGTPFPALPQDLKPNFPIPTDTYGPPGHTLGPIGPNDQVVVHGGSNVHYGPPQPDPNPKPPHPGIPAPPTPPHVLYDGWKPIPGVSKPIIEQDHHNHIENDHGVQNHIHADDQYGPPPPPPPPFKEIPLNLDGHSLPNIDQGLHSSDAQINTGYSSVHQDALANIDLNALVGGDSNHIDQSKTVFEAHYTENHNPQADLNIISASLPSGSSDFYSAPPSESLSHGHYPSSIRQQGGKGLIPPSGIYGVPPGSHYGAPPRSPPSNLPIPYGSYSGGGHSIHTGGSTPKHPIKFRESVPEGLFTQIGQSTQHKDAHGINNHPNHGPQYLPPPIRDVKDIHQQTGNHGVSSLSLSIEPSNLYSLPNSGNPINFQNHGQPSNLYGSPYDSYSVPLFTVGDNTGSASSINEVKASLDGTILSNLTREEVEALLKHCPYHEAILKAAKFGDKIPSELASSYVASLSSLGSTLSKSQQTLLSPHNSFNTPAAGSESVSYNSKDLQTASHSLVQTILSNNDIKQDKTEKNSIQKGKAMRDDSGKHSLKDNNIQFVTDQIYETSEKIKNLSEETKRLQQKIVSTSQNLNQVNGQISQFGEIPVKGKLGSYSLQIQAADGHGKGAPSIPHEQLLSEGLLQSILSAIEQPNSSQQQRPQPNVQFQQPPLPSSGNINLQFQQPPSPSSGNINLQFQQPPSPSSSNINLQFQQPPSPSSGNINFSNFDEGGLILPAGYEPIDRTKGQSQKPVDQDVQASYKDIKTTLHKKIHKHTERHRGDIPQTECDLKADNSIRHTIVVPPPSLNIDNVPPVNEIDENDVAIYFNESKTEATTEKSEPVTEISVATSISENVDNYSDKRPDFGDKIDKKQS